MTQPLTKELFLVKISRSLEPSLVTIHDSIIQNLTVEKSVNMGSQESLPNGIRSPLDAIRFDLAMNSINHQFWDLSPAGFERYSNNGKVGAMAMLEGLKNAVESFGGMDQLEEELPFTEAFINAYFGPIPDTSERAKILSQALSSDGKKLAEFLLQTAIEGKTWSLAHAEIIAESLPLGFQDPFLKKAQLVLYMISEHLKMQFGISVEVVTTCFADYQVPKVLRGLGVLEYSESLAQKVDHQELLDADSVEERAVRAATIIACEKISQVTGFSVPDLDYWLWSHRNDFKAPFHLTKTTRY